MRRYICTLILLSALGFVSSCQPAEPTPLPPVLPTLGQPTAFPPTATLLPTVTLEPSPTPTLATTLTPTATLPARTPVIAPPVACRNSSATISAPTMDSQVTDIIEIRGAATHPILQYWKVEYRTDGNPNYAMLGNGDAPIVNEVLARLATRTLPNGVYWLRLTVVQKDGQYPPPCEIRFTIANP